MRIPIHLQSHRHLRFRVAKSRPLGGLTSFIYLTRGEGRFERTALHYSVATVFWRRKTLLNSQNMENLNFPRQKKSGGSDGLRSLHAELQSPIQEPQPIMPRNDDSGGKLSMAGVFRKLVILASWPEEMEPPEHFTSTLVSRGHITSSGQCFKVRRKLGQSRF